MLLTHVLRMSHISLIRKYPKGVSAQQRYQANDRWIAQMEHPHMKTYYSQMLNLETQTHSIDLRENDEERAKLSEVRGRYLPKAQEMWSGLRLIEPKGVGDKVLVKDISNMTLYGFIKEGITKKEGNHMLLFSWVLFAIVVPSYLWFLWKNPEVKNMKLRMTLNPEILDDYDVTHIQKSVKEIKDIIKIYQKNYEQKLQQVQRNAK